MVLDFDLNQPPISEDVDGDETNSGDDNSGNYDAGSENVGNDNSGVDDSGNSDSGDGNSGDDSAGNVDSGVNDSGNNDSGDDNIEYDEYYEGTFEQTYRCFPLSCINKLHLENGDKIIMPPSALEQLASLAIVYPMLFELHNPETERISHCGVLEFIAEEGVVYLPDWMMKNMLLKEGDIMSMKNATLPKATYVKLEPHTKDFLNISNPKAVLEATLRNFSCLTTGDTIVVPYNNKKYSINILETKPNEAVCIVETDCEVDFAPPLDYVEPTRLAPQPEIVSPRCEAPVKEEATEERPKFVPFMGVARRLDGKPFTPLAEPYSSSVLKPQPHPTTSSLAASSVSSRKREGTLLFGSDGQAPKRTQVPTKENNPESVKKDEQKFQAFTGKKYSLTG